MNKFRYWIVMFLGMCNFHLYKLYSFNFLECLIFYTLACLHFNTKCVRHIYLQYFSLKMNKLPFIIEYIMLSVFILFFIS